MDEQQEVKELQAADWKKKREMARERWEGDSYRGVSCGFMRLTGIYLVCLAQGSQIVVTRGVKAAGEDGAVLDADSRRERSMSLRLTLIFTIMMKQIRMH